MQIKLKNSQLAETSNLLFGLTLKGKQSRQRTKFVKLLNKAYETYQEEERALLVELCHLDKDGNPKVKDLGNGQIAWDYKDEEEFVQEYTEFQEEANTFGGGDADSMLRIVGEVLLDCDMEFGGQDAVFYDELCDLFEEALQPAETSDTAQ